MFGRLRELSEITVAETQTILDLDRASSLLIGGKWTAIASASDQGDGWVTVQLGGHLRINVRSSSIEAVKFTDVQPGRKQLDFAFDLGAD